MGGLIKSMVFNKANDHNVLYSFPEVIYQDNDGLKYV